MTGAGGVARLTLVCHASTRAIARAAFPGDEPLDERGLRRAAALAPLIGLAAEAGRDPEAQAGQGGLAPRSGGVRVACAAERRCVQTATALGLPAGGEPDPLLADCDYGRWRGMTLAEVEAAEPEALAAWLADPAAAPHGGEPLLGLISRVADWLSAAAPGRAVAVTHPAVIRAAVVHALDAPARSFWRVDVAPLARVTLTGRGGRWRLGYPE
ncbi:histidine phosphatase family protein [Planomonospora sp. ID67723]|uniref:histidine phosphatase family protein n=1 Tax=Planomonospora sp. ID67723 TaxID=2738134 RepID=UPI0018C3BFCC|nr:histidine phosphatase family protein [Planomonospora sp. ID67723]MBG0833039.1 histidine phosphatase family protein [Planomonospora sp. ID67723]